MYTNMNIDNLEETVINALESIDTQEYTLKIPNKKDLTAFVKLILRNNEFEFNGQLYKQIIGAPMGGIFSPTCTDLHLSVLLINILDKFQWRENIKLHCQYRDDGFMVFTGTLKQVEDFFNIANKIDPLLKFTFEVSSSSMTYLDTEVYKGERFHNNNILDVKSHIKKTETYQYLPITSAHPKHTFTSITVCESIRHIRNNSDINELDRHLTNLQDKLVERGYCKNKTENVIRNVKNTTSRKITLLKADRTTDFPLTFITKYNPMVKNLSKVIRKHLSNLQKDKQCSEIFTQVPIIAYKRNKNIKEYLAKSRK